MEVQQYITMNMVIQLKHNQITYDFYMVLQHTVQPEILAIFKFGGLVPSGQKKYIGRFKLAVVGILRVPLFAQQITLKFHGFKFDGRFPNRQTANLIVCQYFRRNTSLFGTAVTTLHSDYTMLAVEYLQAMPLVVCMDIHLKFATYQTFLITNTGMDTVKDTGLIGSIHTFFHLTFPFHMWKLHVHTFLLNYQIIASGSK